jgi:predicted transcriptional regulator
LEQSSRKLVRDLMKVGVASCAPDTPVPDLANLLIEKGLEAVIILDKDEGHAVGVVSQKELVDAFIREGENARSLKAEDIMCDEVPQVPPDIPLQAAFQLMQDRGIRAVFLMHHAGGVIYSAAYLTYDHALRYLKAKTDDELADLGIRAERISPIQAFIQKRDAARRSRTGQ